MVQKQAAFERIRKEYHHDPLLLSLNDISPRWSKRLQNRLNRGFKNRRVESRGGYFHTTE